MGKPRRVICDHRAAVGDSLIALGAIRALHLSHPGAFLTDFVGHHGRTAPPGNNLTANSPFITPLDPSESEYVMQCYGYAINRAGRPFHFLYGFVEDLSKQLGVEIELSDFRGDIWLSPEEMQPWPGLPENYAVIDAGYKNDFTAKHWSTYRYQQVVNATKDRIDWVQIGSAADNHTILEGVHNLVGQTNLRQLCQIFYRASLVLTPVSLPMHLAAAVPMPGDTPKRAPLTIDEMHRRFAQDRLAGRGMGPMPEPIPPVVVNNRPCIVLAGQREQRHWDAGYPGHVALGTTGKLACGVGIGCGCWRSKVVKIDNDNNICFKALIDEQGKPIPECLERVSVADVVRAVESFL